MYICTYIVKSCTNYNTNIEYHIPCTIYIYTLGFSFESLEEWKEFLWLAIPGVILISGEWWTFEIGSFVTGSIDGVQLAAYNIVLNMMSTGFVVRIVCG